MIERWSRLAILTHWLLLLGVSIGIATGLPIFLGVEALTPYGDVLKTIHRWGTILTLAPAVPLTIARALETLYRGCGEESWWPGWKDIRDGFKIALHWLGLSREYPVIGFHHPMEKLFLLSIHSGLLLLGATGIPMALEMVPSTYKNMFILLHILGFIIVAIPLAGHFMLAINPVNREALHAILYRRYVSLKWAETHHPGWVEKMREMGFCPPE